MAPAPSSSMSVVAARIRTLDRTRTIDDVLAQLDDIQAATGSPTRRLGRRPDGVACFNFMYRRVTQQVRADLDRFEVREVVARLAVVFAQFYFDAYDAATRGASVSKAWEPLFEDRRERGVAPLQFALAGLNAHINNDLPWALMQTWSELRVAPSRNSPEFRDFQRVNDVLAAVAGGVKATLESGFLLWLDRALGRYDDLFESFVIARARNEAWIRAERWYGHMDDDDAAAQERHVGFESHLILAA